jgi:hypothetical protein
MITSARSQRVLVVSGGDIEWTLRCDPGVVSHRGSQLTFRSARLRARRHVPAIRRHWDARDEVTAPTLHCGLSRANEAESRVSPYRGPVLLAYDQAANALTTTPSQPLIWPDLRGSRGRGSDRGDTNLWASLNPWLSPEVPAVSRTAVGGFRCRRPRHALPILAVRPTPAPPPAFTGGCQTRRAFRPDPPCFSGAEPGPPTRAIVSSSRRRRRSPQAEPGPPTRPPGASSSTWRRWHPSPRARNPASGGG